MQKVKTFAHKLNKKSFLCAAGAPPLAFHLLAFGWSDSGAEVAICRPKQPQELPPVGAEKGANQESDALTVSDADQDVSPLSDDAVHV